MDPVEFIISFDTSGVNPSVGTTLLEVLYEYMADGFTDDINVELNTSHGVYLIGTNSGENAFTFTVSKGWSNPSIKEIRQEKRNH